MDTSNLTTIGLLVCVGAVVILALLAFAFRALTGANRRQGGQNMWNNRGQEEPRYDSPDVESRGGFGGVPNTGMDRDRDTDINRGGSVGSAGFGGAQTYNRDRDVNRGDVNRDRDRRRQDDDDVRSSGGFGSG